MYMYHRQIKAMYFIKLTQKLMINPRVADRQQCNARILALIKLNMAVIYIPTAPTNSLPHTLKFNDS